jgi:hypothetical protein
VLNITVPIVLVHIMAVDSFADSVILLKNLQSTFPPLPHNRRWTDASGRYAASQAVRQLNTIEKINIRKTIEDTTASDRLRGKQ